MARQGDDAWRAVAPEIGAQRSLIRLRERFQRRKGVENALLAGIGRDRRRPAHRERFAVTRRELGDASFDFNDRVAGGALERKETFDRGLTQEAQPPKCGQGVGDARLRAAPCGIERLQVDLQPKVVGDHLPAARFRKCLPEERAVGLTRFLPYAHRQIPDYTPPDSLAILTPAKVLPARKRRREIERPSGEFMAMESGKCARYRV